MLEKIKSQLTKKELQEIEELGKMTDTELRRNLITCDFRGTSFKEKVLEKLLFEEYARGFKDGANPPDQTLQG